MALGSEIRMASQYLRPAPVGWSLELSCNRVPELIPQKGMMANPKFSEQAQCATDEDRGKHRHDHQAQIRKHSTSRTPRATAITKAPSRPKRHELVIMAARSSSSKAGQSHSPARVRLAESAKTTKLKISPTMKARNKEASVESELRYCRWRKARALTHRLPTQWRPATPGLAPRQILLADIAIIQRDDRVFWTSAPQCGGGALESSRQHHTAA